LSEESQKFDKVVRTLLSVSHEEIQKRDKEWRRKREKKKLSNAISHKEKTK